MFELDDFKEDIDDQPERPPREKFGKFIDESVPFDENLTKREVFKRSLRVQDVALQRVEEFLYQIDSIKDHAAAQVQAALKEIFHMSDKLLLQLTEKVTEAKKELQEANYLQVEGIQAMLARHLDTVNKTLNSRLEYHLEETHRVTQAAKKDFEVMLNNTASNIATMFKEHQASIKTQVQRIEESIPVKAESEVAKYLDKIVTKAETMADQIEKYHKESIQTLTSFETNTMKKIADFTVKYEKVLDKFRLLSKEFGS